MKLSNLSNKRWAEVEKIMSDGNSLLKSMHERSATLTYRRFREKVISTGVYPKEVASVNEIEEEVVIGCQNLVNKLAWEYSRYKSNLQQDFEDASSEANVALLHAVRGYLGGVKFMTYAHNAISNVLKTFSGTKNYKLKNAYEKMKLELENHKSRTFSFDEVCENMLLTDKEKNILAKCQSVTLIGIDILEMDCSDDSRSPYDQLVQSELSEVVEKVNLDDWEKTVLNAFLTSSSNKSGWQTEIANNTINPKTNKPYSRRAPHLAMERIKEKIREAA